MSIVFVDSIHISGSIPIPVPLQTSQWVVEKHGGCAKERAGFKVDGGILINRAWPSQLPDVATYRPNDTGG